MLIIPALLTGHHGKGLKFRLKENGNKTGVDVMIPIFGDFRQFSAKIWRFPQKPML
jgi:hypothetical protein